MARSKSFNAWMARDDDGTNDVTISLSMPKLGWNNEVWRAGGNLVRVCDDLAPRSTTFLGLRAGQKQRVRITIETIDE